jgi:hypothetical protein
MGSMRIGTSQADIRALTYITGHASFSSGGGTLINVLDVCAEDLTEA